MQTLTNVLNIGPVTELILCFVCQFYVKSRTFYDSSEKRVSYLRIRKTAHFFSYQF